MTSPDNSHCASNCISPAEQLNRDCFCTTLQRDTLLQFLQADELNQDVLASHPQLFSNTSVFISPAQYAQMQRIIGAITRVANLPGYAAETLAKAPAIAAHNPGTQGVFMGYDFHLSAQGPQIIEINTNAGGAFLNAALLSAQSECCRAAGMALPASKTALDEEFMVMFLQEWRLQRGSQVLTSVAIVDENPRQQFLYPEFKMAQRLFERHGLTAIIADPSELTLSDNQVYCHNQPIDLIYNRLTDFALEQPAQQILRAAYLNNAAVITPNPRQHALFADKRNLVSLSNPEHLRALGAAASDIAVLQAGIPATQKVSVNNADQLWQTRKQLFFKPASGFGSRAAYRGDKLTKRVWDEILAGDYVAQQLVPPSERGILVDGQGTALKIDIRAYVYAGDIQLLAARLYQGQTTNFRTAGGGFAPVFIADKQ